MVGGVLGGSCDHVIPECCAMICTAGLGSAVQQYVSSMAFQTTQGARRLSPECNTGRRNIVRLDPGCTGGCRCERSVGAGAVLQPGLQPVGAQGEGGGDDAAAAGDDDDDDVHCTAAPHAATAPRQPIALRLVLMAGTKPRPATQHNWAPYLASTSPSSLNPCCQNPCCLNPCCLPCFFPFTSITHITHNASLTPALSDARVPDACVPRNLAVFQPGPDPGQRPS